MPSTDQFSRPVAGDDVVGLHPEQDHRGLGLRDLQLDALDARGRRSRSVAKSASGSALTRSPISRSETLIGVPTTSRTTRMPWLPDRVLELVAGQRTEVAQHDDRRAGRAGPGAEQGVADQRTAADAGLLEPGLQRRRRWPSRSSCGGRGRVAHLDDLVVGHQLAGPLDDADADEQQREAEGQARGRGWRRRGRRWCRGSSPIWNDEVGDDEQHRAEHRQHEQRRRPGARRASRPSGRRRSGATWCGGRPGVRRSAPRSTGARSPCVVVGRSSLTLPPSPWSNGSCGRRSRPRSRPGRRCRRARRTGPR